MNTLNSFKFSLPLTDKVVVEYYLFVQNGVEGVAGSNPVVPTKLSKLIKINKTFIIYILLNKVLESLYIKPYISEVFFL